MSESEVILEFAKIVLPALITWFIARRKNEAEAVKSLVEAATGGLVEKTTKDNDRLRGANDILRDENRQLLEENLGAESLAVNLEIVIDTNNLLLTKKCGVDPLLTINDAKTKNRNELKRVYLGISNS